MNRRRKFLFFLASLACVAVLLSIFHHFQLRRAVDEYKAELKARGEPVELENILPPPVSADQNGAGTFTKAEALLDSDNSVLRTNWFSGMEMVAPGKALVRWAQPEVRDDFTTNSWNEITSALDQNKEALKLLRQVAFQPGIRFPIAYSQGINDLGYTNLHLATLKKSAEYLGMSAIDALRRGDDGNAVTDTRAMLKLVKAMQDQRLVISELVRIAMANIALTINWEILQATTTTDDQLASLQSAWQGLDFITGYKDALTMERIVGEISLEKWRGSKSGFLDYLDQVRAARERMGMTQETQTIFSRAQLRARIFLWRHWWSYADELRSLKGDEALVEAIRFAETNGAFIAALDRQFDSINALGITGLSDGLSSMFSDVRDFHSLLSQSIVSLSRSLKRVMAVEVARNVVVSAIALKRYQLKHGFYPEKISDLVPEFLTNVPHDPIDGQFLRYRKNTDGTFLLYSVGENGLDEGGDPTNPPGFGSGFYWQSQHAHDWVWPQSAKAEEIESHYQNRTKKSHN